MKLGTKLIDLLPVNCKIESPIANLVFTIRYREPNSYTNSKCERTYVYEAMPDTERLYNTIYLKCKLNPDDFIRITYKPPSWKILSITNECKGRLYDLAIGSIDIFDTDVVKVSLHTVTTSSTIPVFSVDLSAAIYQKDNVIEYEEISISETKPLKLK